MLTSREREKEKERALLAKLPLELELPYQPINFLNSLHTSLHQLTPTPTLTHRAGTQQLYDSWTCVTVLFEALKPLMKRQRNS